MNPMRAAPGDRPVNGWLTRRPLISAVATPSGARVGGKSRRDTWLPLMSAAIVAVIAAIQIPVLLEVASRPNWNGYGGIDHDLYMRVASRWLATGVYFEPYQVAGPYAIQHGAVLYPPVALWLFVPFTVLPSILWWAVPLGVTAWVVWRLRPGPLAWPLLAAVLGWQPVQIHIISGNPVLWATMFVALGTLYRWPSVFAFLKPSLGIFALFGSWDRRWWYSAALVAIMSLPFGLHMWVDWSAALLNSRGGGLLYSWQEAPLMLLPLIAWLARPGSRYGFERRARGPLGLYAGPERRSAIDASRT